MDLKIWSKTFKIAACKAIACGLERIYDEEEAFLTLKGFVCWPVEGTY